MYTRYNHFKMLGGKVSLSNRITVITTRDIGLVRLSAITVVEKLIVSGDN